MMNQINTATQKKKILFVGDSFFRTTSDRLPFENVMAFLEDYTVIVNCETVIMNERTTRRRQGKLVHVGTEEETLGDETLHPINAVTVANNHILDFGVEGLQNTLEFFTSHNITPIGIIGQECSSFVVNGQKVTVFACAERQDRIHRVFPTIRHVADGIQKVRKDCDYVVVAVHWGTEYAHYPSPRQRKQAISLIEAGADLIVGHHSHVFQGTESYRGKQVYYSLGNGNFGSWQNRYSEWSRVALCVELNVQSKGVSTREHYLKIDDDYSLMFLGTDELQEAKNRFSNISGKNLHMAWIPWGMAVSEVFVRQEMDAFRERFRDKAFLQGFVFLYWLTRPKTLFLLFCFLVKRLRITRAFGWKKI